MFVEKCCIHNKGTINPIKKITFLLVSKREELMVEMYGINETIEISTSFYK